MNFDHLKIFQTTARESSMSKAAQKLNITQPALSRHLKTIENEIGFQLLERHSQGIRLNKNGHRFLEMTDRILQDYSSTVAELREENGIDSNRLILSFSAAGNHIADLTYEFRKKWPNVWFELRDYEHDAFDKESNFFIFATYKKLKDDSEAIYLGCEELFLAAKKDSEYAAIDNITLESLSNKNFLTTSRTNDMYEIQKYYCEMAGFSPMSDNIIEKQLVMIQLISRGMGVSILPKTINPELVSIPISDIECYRYLYMLPNKHVYKTKLATVFERYAVQFFHEIFRNRSERI